MRPIAAKSDAGADAEKAKQWYYNAVREYYFSQ